MEEEETLMFSAPMFSEGNKTSNRQDQEGVQPIITAYTFTVQALQYQRRYGRQ